MGLRNQQALFFMYFRHFLYLALPYYALLNKRAKPSLLLVAVLA